MTETELSREQRKAVVHFFQYFPVLDDLIQKSPQINKSTQLFQTNYVSASMHPYQISRLPREPHWTWNQSNAKIVYQDSNVHVTFKKISPRLRNPEENAPSYKMWLYEIQVPGKMEKYFLWCEKGIETTQNQKVTKKNDHSVMMEGIETEIGTIFPQQISIQSLSFLAPYADPATAIELGWL